MRPNNNSFMVIFALCFFNLFSTPEPEPAVIEITPFIGVDPVLAEKYEKAINSENKSFACFDGTKIIDMSKFNDNYPDCPDGSDEPGTPASSESLFYCKNENYVPTFIHRWSVGDGLCDCCDGSDEAFNPSAKCFNTCANLEKKRLSLFSSVEKAFSKGNKKYHKLVEEGTEHQINGQKIFDEYNVKIEKLEKAKSDIENSQTRQTPTPTPEPAEESAQQEGEEQQEELINDQVAAEKVGGPEAEVLDSVQDNAQEVVEEEKEEPTNCLQTNDKDFFYSFNFSFCIDDGENPYPNGLTYDEKRERKAAIQDKIDDLNNEMNQKEPFIKFINKNIPPALMMLANQEFSNGNFKYTFLDEIKESYSSHGKFKEIQNGEFYHDNGAYCWETQCGKKTRMRFSCWDENKLVGVVENSRCEYKAVFATPAACTDDLVARVANMTVEELETVRKDAGV
ncbi:hypothetical protein TRFO_10827 [Tritrichomonas foetus]|uniref:Glucosidase 2 subunit beta n=1 Tax=Tritrichomonas foetus TaxID=1144522 RepID=A0A1J4J6S0_9EUKA|nr:hypothetical protein TRFO_10827 [Tritrichomonas foetus]|eukprot:OHS94888.1 hypothetical protein TRFO_10827 [Tritrichomonas foetus]